MGFGKKKRQVRDAVSDWKCFGYFGYGEGKAVNQFGENSMSGKSACSDICNRANACRAIHHNKMNERFPILGQMVEVTSRIATVRNLNVVDQVMSAMNHAIEENLPEAIEVKKILSIFKVSKMTDHYRCGQFENIQDGLNSASPGHSADKNSKKD